jgi:predicted nucleic acid-binding protein
MSDGVVLDTCVLFPASLRDTLLRAADANLYSLQLTEDILEEMCRNLVNKHIMHERKAQSLVDAIRRRFPHAVVTGHESATMLMPLNESDRHVLAAAVTSKAKAIVTQNLRDFPAHLLNPYGVKAQSPDEFLVFLFHSNTARMIQIVIEQARQLRKPPKTVLELLDTLTQHTPMFAGLVRQALEGGDVI